MQSENYGDSSDKSLADMGNRVHNAFKYLCASCSNQAVDLDPVRQKVVNEYERFDLWAVNIGLYHSGHSSLDYRFRDAPSFADFVRHLLSELAELVVDARESLDKKSQVTQRQSDQLNEDNGRVTTPSCADNEAISEDDDSSSVETFGSYEDDDIMETTLNSIIDKVDRLYRMAIKIRNPGTRIGSSKARKFRQLDQETGVDVFDVYSRFDELHMQQKLAALRGMDPASLGDYYLVGRLTLANRIRRQQFALWRRHKAKMKNTSLQRDQIPMSRSHHDDRRAVQLELAARRINQPEMSEVESKPTTATEFDQTKFDLHDDRSVISDRTVLIFENSDEHGGIEIPRLPDRLLSQKEFECPYCFTMCSRKTLERSAWEAHVYRDLRPYLCTQKHCRNSEQQYDSFHDWSEHEIRSHYAETINQISESNNIASSSQERTTSSQKTSTLDSMRCTCPLCSREIEGMARYHNHVAIHLRQIALFALPRSTDIEDEADDHDADSGDADRITESFDSREPDFQDGSSGEQETVNNFGEGSEVKNSKDVHDILDELYYSFDPMIEHWSLSAFDGSPLTKLQPDGRSSECFADSQYIDYSKLCDELGYTFLFGIRPSSSRSFEVGLYVRQRDDRARIVCSVLENATEHYSLPLTELRIGLQGCTLELLQQNRIREQLWATLTFRHFETLLIFRSVLLAMRTFDTREPINPDDRDYVSDPHNQEFFAGRAVEDGALMALRVFGARSGRRAYIIASYLRGALEGAPYWIAFIDQHIGDPRWVSRTNQEKVRLRSLTRHVLNSDYVPQTDRDGTPELIFLTSSDADAFINTIEDLAKDYEELEDKASEGDTEKIYKKQ